MKTSYKYKSTFPKTDINELRIQGTILVSVNQIFTASFHFISS